MSLQLTLESALKDALRSGAETRKTALRLIIAGLKNAQVEKQADLTDADILGLIRREIKSQREAIADAQKANRPDLIAQAEALIEIMEAFLPRQLSREEIRQAVQPILAELDAHGPADLGRVMKVVQPKLKDQADGKTLSEVVKELLAAQT